MSLKLCFAVVLYNGYINDIASLDVFMSFCDKDKAKLIILDNSNQNYTVKNTELLNKNNYKNLIYINNGGNIGLSKSYNKAIEIINDEDYWLMLCDDDTHFSNDYINNVYEYINGDHDCDLITGLITANGKITSPVRRNGVFKKDADMINEYGIYENIYPINSGVVIHNVIFDKVKFNENLFLDMIDYCFMDDLIKNKLNRFIVLEGYISQEFSFSDNSDMASVKNRFSIFKKDFSNYCRIQKKDLFYKLAILGKRSLRIKLQEMKSKH